MNATHPPDGAEPTRPKNKPVVRAVITLGLSLDDLTLGHLRWLVGVCDKAGAADGTSVGLAWDYEGQTPLGIELHLGSDHFPSLDGGSNGS